MAHLKRVRIIKKVRVSSGVWRFVSLKKSGSRYVWDRREGRYFVEWWDGPKRRREVAGTTPSEALEAQRRKRNELIGEAVSGGKRIEAAHEDSATPLVEARESFLSHVRVQAKPLRHSPDKPKTHQRYSKVLEHFERHIGAARLVETVTRLDIGDYKEVRSQSCSQQHPGRRITPRTINFEISVLRTFFNFMINERGTRMENPCARFKALRDPRAKARSRPPTYSQAEIDRLVEVCDEFERAVFATFLLTGLREQELCFLTWPDIDLRKGREAVRVRTKEGFSPKDYEERVIPIPVELARRLADLPRDYEWTFPTAKGGRQTHLLRRLKRIALNADVEDATLHKFRHSYATRLLESGCDIVTVQRLMGHSDIKTTRQYLDPDEARKREAVARLSMSG